MFDSKKTVDKLKHENAVLKNRCRALTSGTLCVLCMGHPIYIATKEWQRRKHRKKRINKKWLKRYGTYELNLMPHEQVLMMDDGTIWMTKKTWLQLKPALERFNPELPECRCRQ